MTQPHQPKHRSSGRRRRRGRRGRPNRDSSRSGSAPSSHQPSSPAKPEKKTGRMRGAFQAMKNAGRRFFGGKAKEPDTAADTPRTTQSSQERPPKRHSRGQQGRGGRRQDQSSRPGHGRNRNQGRRGGPDKFVEGVLQVKGRVGFVLSEEPGKQDTLIQGASLGMARDGDRVKARLFSDVKGGRSVGSIVSVLQRARSSAVGEFRLTHGHPTLISEQENLHVRLENPNKLSPAEGDIIVAEITQWPSKDSGARGVLKKHLGPPEKAGIDLLSVIHRAELPEDFPQDVLKEAGQWGGEVDPKALEGRKTFFDDAAVTIDGKDAADFDDAVSLNPKPGGGWQLAVHIADVSHYVREGSALDREARERGTSVYFPGKVLPMLPEALSNNLCSLRPDLIRLTLSCVMDISPDGNVTRSEFFEGAIKSARRFTYEEVERVLKGENVENTSEALRASVVEMDKLARLVRKKRIERGSLDFDFPEPDVILDAHGRTVDIQKRLRLESHRLIEDFMLLANESAARFMQDVPFIYRVHETPDETKFEKLKTTLDSVGLSLPKNADLKDPRTLQRVIGMTDDRPVQPIVQMMILRSLKQAVYSPINKGHFGLASKCYTHFTSPIRRYPDLIVHRLIRERLQKRLNEERQARWSKILGGISVHTSRRERAAVDAEREFIGLQKVRLMADKVGSEFDGAVSGVAAFGLFIQLKDMFVEGMTPIETLDDAYVFEEARMRLVGKKRKKVFFVGQKVHVRLVKADPVKRQLEFQLLSAENHGEIKPRPPKPSHGGKRRRRR